MASPLPGDAGRSGGPPPLPGSDESMDPSIFRTNDDDTVIREWTVIRPVDQPAWQAPPGAGAWGGYPPPPPTPPIPGPVPGIPVPATRPAPPSLAATILVSLFFGVFGLIPAARHSRRAAELGYPSGRYWGAFAGALVASLLVPVLLFWGLITALGLASSQQSADSGRQPVVTRTAVATEPTSQPIEESSEGGPVDESEEQSGDYQADTPYLEPGSWVTVLASISQDEPVWVARQQADEIAAKWNVAVSVVDTDQTSGLNGGWWAVVMTGFHTGAEARDACSRVGRDVGGSCYGRQITG